LSTRTLGRQIPKIFSTGLMSYRSLIIFLLLEKKVCRFRFLQLVLIRNATLGEILLILIPQIISLKSPGLLPNEQRNSVIKFRALLLWLSQHQQLSFHFWPRSHFINLSYSGYWDFEISGFSGVWMNKRGRKKKNSFAAGCTSIDLCIPNLF